MLAGTIEQAVVTVDVKPTKDIWRYPHKDGKLVQAYFSTNLLFLGSPVQSLAESFALKGLNWVESAQPLLTPASLLLNRFT